MKKIFMALILSLVSITSFCINDPLKDYKNVIVESNPSFSNKIVTLHKPIYDLSFNQKNEYKSISIPSFIVYDYKKGVKIESVGKIIFIGACISSVIGIAGLISWNEGLAYQESIYIIPFSISGSLFSISIPMWIGGDQ